MGGIRDDTTVGYSFYNFPGLSPQPLIRQWMAEALTNTIDLIVAASIIKNQLSPSSRNLYQVVSACNAEFIFIMIT